MKTRIFQKSVGLVVLVFLFGCVKDRNFDAPQGNCIRNIVANTTYAEVKNLYAGQTLQIQQDLIIEGYVVSSDKAGNFFSVLHFQDNAINPIEGFQIEIDVRDSNLFYPVGSRIFIKLKGLYLGKSKDVFKLGATFTSFGNLSVGRLPATVIDQHIFTSCDDVVDIIPFKASIDSLQKNMTNTLVRFDAIEILEDELGESFAIEREETERTLIDCNDNDIVLLNSGFSDFQAELLPEGNGTITGVLLRENNTYSLAIRSLEDIDFSNERCEDLVDEFTSTALFISELADPENNTGARFIELYNAASTSLSLKGWSLRRYTNASMQVSSEIDLSELVIGSESTLVISPNATEFEAVYGFAPDFAVGTNSPVDSNGDDNLELVDPFGTVIDVFGIVGEDGTGTNHEFEDGRAFRNAEINRANPVYDFNEWTIYNDSGDAGTILQPQSAPEDFTPGNRN